MFSRSYSMAPSPLGASSLNPLHFPLHPVSASPLSGTRCLPLGLCPTGQTRVPGRQQRDAVPRSGLKFPLQRGLCQNEAGAGLAAIWGKATELNQRKLACNSHARLSLVGPLLETMCYHCFFHFKEGAKRNREESMF